MTSLKGNLNSVDLANIFQMLSLNQREGTLYIFEGASRKAIYFGHDGISMLAKGKGKGLADPLGRILVRYDRISADDLRRAVEQQTREGRLLGQVLVERGSCKQTDIDEALHVQIQEEVYNLFIWKDAQFEFVEGEPDADFKSDGVQRLTFNVNSLIMEAARRVDEWEWIQSLVPGTQEVFRYSGTNVDLADPIFEEAYAGKVLAAIDGRRSVEELIECSYVNKFEVCKILALLVDAAAVERLPVSDLSREAHAAVAAGDAVSSVKFLSLLCTMKADTPETHKQLGVAFEKLNEFAQAAEHYRVYAEDCASQGDCKTAFETYRRICEMLPTDLGACDRLTEVFTARADGIEEHAKEIVERGKRLAECFTEIGRASRAIAVLHRVVALGPEDPDLRNRLINVYIASGMSGEAIGEYEALAEEAVAAKDYEAGERIYRKILALDRNRPEATTRLNQIISRRKRRARGVRGLAIGGATLVVLAGAGWYLWNWYSERRSEEQSRDTEGQRKIAELRAEAAPIATDVDAVMSELASQRIDVALQAEVLKRVLPRLADLEKRTNAAVKWMVDVRSEFEGTPADAAARGLADEANEKLVLLKRRVADLQKALREGADAMLEEARRSTGVKPTREILAQLVVASRITEDCPGWPGAEECRKFRANVESEVERAERTKKQIEEKLAAHDFDEAYRIASEYHLNGWPPKDLRDEVLVPINLLSRPLGARVSQGGVDTGLETGPDCIVRISLTRGETFDFELKGFERGQLAIAAVKDGDPVVIAQKIKPRWTANLEKRLVFRKPTSDDARIGAAPSVWRGVVVVPTRAKNCDLVDATNGQFLNSLATNSASGVQAGGLIVPAGQDGAIVVLPTCEGVLQFFDAVSAKFLGSWNETRGGLSKDLAADGDDVLAADGGGDLHCVSASRRRRLWHYLAGSAMGDTSAFSTGPVVFEGRAWIGCEDGAVHCVELESGKGRIAIPARSEFGRVTAPPVFDDGFAYVVNRDATRRSRVTKWNVAAGRSEWTQQVAGEVRSAPMLRDGTVFLVTTQGEVVALKALDGSQAVAPFSLGTGVKVLAEAVMDDSAIYVGCDDGTLAALDVRGTSIDVMWRYQVRSAAGRPVPITTRCVIAGDLILFGADDHAVYALQKGE